MADILRNQLHVHARQPSYVCWAFETACCHKQTTEHCAAENGGVSWFGNLNGTIKESGSFLLTITPALAGT